jgi:hypothetical protein
VSTEQAIQEEPKRADYASETRDFYLACFLRCAGYELVNLRDEGRRKVFVFRDRATGVTAISLVEVDGVCIWRVGIEFDPAAVSIHWLPEAEAASIVKQAKREAGKHPNAATATAALPSITAPRSRRMPPRSSARKAWLAS